MDDLGPLFHDDTPPPDAPDGPRTFGVLELNEAIADALRQAFPAELWLRGEIQGLSRTRMRKHWYFQLVEKEAGRDQPLSQVAVNLLDWNRRRVERDMAAAPGFELQDDVEVRIKVKVSYFAPWGKLQLEMVGVDPSFSLGQLAANRERILRALAAEDLLERNRQHEFPELPLRVGLITSIGSAAYNDFVEELQLSGLPFRVQAVDARVQGDAAETSLLQGLHHFRRNPVDVVCLIRGGGSRSDLASFDSEKLARAIAHHPLAVITGIGHEIDRSVADEVAWANFKTPTAVAAALVRRATGFVEKLDEHERGIVDAARDRIHGESSRLLEFSQRAARASSGRMRQEVAAIDLAHGRLGREAPRALRRSEQTLIQMARRSARAGRHRVEGETFRLERARLALGPARLGRRLERKAAELRRRADRLPPLLRRALDREGAHQEQLIRQLRLLDPHRILSRGYSLSYGPDGKLLKSTEDLLPGTPLRTILAVGEIHSRIEKLQAPSPSDGQESGDS